MESTRPNHFRNLLQSSVEKHGSVEGGAETILFIVLDFRFIFEFEIKLAK